MQCGICQIQTATKPTRRQNERTPRGWHHKDHDGQTVTYCPKCWAKFFRLRTITFPVIGILNPEFATPKERWEAFREAMRQAWGQSTRLANWAVCELAKADIMRHKNDEKLPAMPLISLYQLWQKHYEREEWAGAAQSANALMRSVELKYRKTRLDTVWFGTAVLPRYRYPMPYPCHNAAWKAEYQSWTSEDGQISKVPTVNVAIAGKRWQIRLRGGRERARQLKAFQQILAGQAVEGELSIYRRRASEGAHRPTQTDRAPGGGAKVSYRIMVKIAAWLPRPWVEEVDLSASPGTSIEEKLRAIERRGRQGTMELRTANNALFVAVMPEREDPWLLHADHVWRWIARHRRILDRLSDDTKAEVRSPKRKKRQLLDRLEVLTHRQRCRMDTFIHTAARMVVGAADRYNILEIRYDDSNKRYFHEFPWFRLRQLIQEKALDLAIEFVHTGTDEATAEVETGDAEPEVQRAATVSSE